MDVSPIQRMAITANQAARPVETVQPVAPAVPPAAQAAPAAADESVTQRNQDAATQVLVAWHAGSLGYVTSVVDRHTGEVLYQTPPEQVLNMVQEVIERLEGDAT